MKRNGVINQPLSGALAGLGHGDTFLVCDAGFPIPGDAERIDLALCFGVPNMEQCIKAILDEIIVQKIEIAAEMRSLNEDGYKFIYDTFCKQELMEIPQDELVKQSKDVKFIVRTGELGCYSNIILEAASGVPYFKNSFVINV